MTVIANDIDGFDDVGVLEGGTDAELCGDLLLVLLLCFTVAFRTKLLDGEDGATVFAAGLDETNGSTCARAEHAAPLAVLLVEVGVVLAEVLAEADGPLEPVVQALTEPDPDRRADVETAFALLENAIGPGVLWPTWATPSGTLRENT